MAEAISLEAIYIYIYTGNFIELVKGNFAFINNEKLGRLN